ATNRGPSLATAVLLTNTLPAGVVFVSASPTQGTCSQNSGVVNCTLGTIVGGTRVDVLIVVRPTASGQLTNRASVVTTAFDPNTANNSATLVTHVSPTIQSISDRTILEDSVLGPISFTVGYQETPAGSLTLTGTSSNPSIVPVDNISYGGSGAS